MTPSLAQRDRNGTALTRRLPGKELDKSFYI